jgi:hypothetical protein
VPVAMSSISILGQAISGQVAGKGKLGQALLH